MSTDIHASGTGTAAGAAGAPDQAGGPARPGWLRAHERGVIGAVAVVLAIIAWEVASRTGVVDPLYASSPTRIAVRAWAYFTSPVAWQDIRVSGTQFVVGFSMAMVVGIGLGIAIGWYKYLDYALDPFITFLYTSPRIAFMPLLIIWLGIGLASKVAIVFLGAVFPIIISTASGIKSTDAMLLKVARSFGASDRKIFTSVALPGSVPMIISGLRLGLAHGLIGIVVGELVAATAGVGYRMTQSAATFQTDLVFALLITIAGIGVALTALFRRIERQFDKWRPELHA